ncbi:hypothetical protein Q460_16075 [Escherichia coli ATCC BAA-2219]|nr:hypothetical protein Q460_16075 [Escherichia coli ATCC BAA-2219]
MASGDGSHQIIGKVRVVHAGCGVNALSGQQNSKIQ